MARTALYRLYDERGALLYVGISANLENRWAQHRRVQAWWPQVAATTTEWFDDRVDAAKAEAAAIRTENPIKNAVMPDDDGLGGWAPIPGRHADELIKTVNFRAPDELWRKFTTAIDQVPEAGISMVLRQFLRWYAGEPGAKLPERPTWHQTPPGDNFPLPPGGLVDGTDQMREAWAAHKAAGGE
jgi:predicted GIY-YIG superfamily endonuclease